MKDNNNMLQGGKLLPEYHQSWANYFIKFIKAYEKEGIQFGAYLYKMNPWQSKLGNLAFLQQMMN
jgi:glucosylceramidase